jgi:hypothetical protein
MGDEYCKKCKKNVHVVIRNNRAVCINCRGEILLFDPVRPVDDEGLDAWDLMQSDK